MKKQLDIAFGSANRMAASVSGTNVTDFGVNQEMQKVVSENDHIYRKNVENLLEEGRVELMPRKAKRFLEWLEINHGDFFQSLEVNPKEAKVEIVLVS